MNLTIALAVLEALGDYTLTDFIAYLLSHPTLVRNPTRTRLVEEWPAFLKYCLWSPSLSSLTDHFITDYTTKKLTNEVAQLANKESGWHFSARTASAEQIDEFSIGDMADRLETQAPTLWTLLGHLLESDPVLARRRAQYLHAEVDVPAPAETAADVVVDWDDEMEFWANDVYVDPEEREEIEGVGPHGPRPRKRQRRAADRTQSVNCIRRVMIMSIMMITTNQKCNPIASVLGFFCHSTSAPELLIEVLAHAGLSVSLTATHSMINSLSEKSAKFIREIAQTKTAAFAYDNFDMDFKSYASTVERPGTTLQHATSALIFPLEHDVEVSDLKFSDELWSTDPVNLRLPKEQLRRKRTWKNCIPRGPNVPGPSINTRLNAWHFRHALVTFCDDFKGFRSDLGMPETVLQIPVKKTRHVPCRAMDINQSTADGNAQVVQNLFTQANIGDPADNPAVQDIGDHIVFMHGDLGTGEHLESVRRSRAIEKTSVRRLQPIVFAMGLFHYQMALADTIWRMFIEPKHLRTDPNSLYQHACRSHPHQSGRIGSKPGFHLINAIIHQCAYARILDVWETEVRKRNPSHATLGDYAKSKPTWDQLVELSIRLAQMYLDKPEAKDKLFRNNTLILARLIHYLELTHAMKHGDIGRVQETFMDSVRVFKTVGKHKYATALLDIMIKLKYIFPPRLARAFLLNWLCNPTGKVNGFRAIDWVVELMNLFIKVIYGSSGYTRTLRLILKQSALIETFRKVHLLMQDNFHLMHRTVRHAPPDIQNTLTILRDLLRKSKGHLFIPDRPTGMTATLRAHFTDGMKILTTPKKANTANDEGDDDDEENRLEEELDIDDLEA